MPWQNIPTYNSLQFPAEQMNTSGSKRPTICITFHTNCDSRFRLL